MRISVIGCGYLGAVHAAGMASLGHETVGIDVDAAKIERLSAGVAPFHEPQFDELLHEQLESGRLTFSTDPAATSEARVHFIGVGTPQQEGSHAADLRYVDAAVQSLLPNLKPGDLVVGKSTVPVGTARRLRDIVRKAEPEADLVWNPEFLREGFAVDDTLHPDRIVIGVADDSEHERTVTVLDEVYRRILDEDTPRLIVGLETAELVKVAANSFLATKISFINAMAEVCETAGGDVAELADAIGLDERIGRRFLNAGLGFGGGCLPKDIRAFQARADELGTGESLAFLADVDAINSRRRDRAIALAAEAVGRDESGEPGTLTGVNIAVWGLAFKPNSDDIRDSPSLAVASRLIDAGATVKAFDPAANENATRALPGLNTVESELDAADDADVIVLGTEWKQFREIDPAKVGARVAARNIVDARNCLDREAWADAGWTVRTPGRPIVEPTSANASA